MCRKLPSVSIAYRSKRALLILLVVTGAAHLTFSLPNGDIDGPKIVVDSTQAGSFGVLSFGRTVLAAAVNNKILLYDTKTYAQVGLLDGSDAAVTAMALSPSGDWLVSGNSDGQCVIWNLRNQKIEFTLTKNGPSISQVGVDRGGKKIFIADRNSSISIWYANEGRLQKKYPRLGQIAAFSPDGRYLAAATTRNFLRLIDLSNGNTVAAKALDPNPGGWTLGPLKRAISLDSLTFSPDGRRVIDAGTTENDGPKADKSHDSITAWNVRNLSELTSSTVLGDLGHVTFNAKLTRFYTGTTDGSVMIWQFPSCKKLGVVKIDSTKAARQIVLRINDTEFNGAGVLALAVNPDGSKLAAGTSEVGLHVWRLPDLSPVYSNEPFAAGVQSVAFERTGNTLITGGDTGGLTFWNGEPDVRMRRVNAKHGPITQLAISGDGVTVASVALDETVEYRSVKEPFNAVAIPPEHFTVFGSDYRVAFTADDKFLLITGAGGKIRVWNLSQGKEGQGLQETDSIRGFAFSPTRHMIAVTVGSILAALTASGFNVKVYDVPSWSLLKTIPKLDAPLQVFSPDGKWLVSFNADLNQLKVRSTTDWAIVKTLSDVTRPVIASLFSPDGSLFASEAEDGMIRLWEVADWNEKCGLHGYPNEAGGGDSRLAFDAFGCYLASGENSGVTRIWDVKTCRDVISIIASSIGSDYLVVTPEGLFDGSPYAMQRVYWRDPDDVDLVPLDAFYNDFFHPGLLAEVFEGKRPQPPYDLATRLRFPALRTMAQQGLASIQKLTMMVLMALVTTFMTSPILTAMKIHRHA